MQNRPTRRAAAHFRLGRWARRCGSTGSSLLSAIDSHALPSPPENPLWVQPLNRPEDNSHLERNEEPTRRTTASQRNETWPARLETLGAVSVRTPVGNST